MEPRSAPPPVERAPTKADAVPATAPTGARASVLKFGTRKLWAARGTVSSTTYQPEAGLSIGGEHHGDESGRGDRVDHERPVGQTPHAGALDQDAVGCQSEAEDERNSPEDQRELIAPIEHLGPYPLRAGEVGGEGPEEQGKGDRVAHCLARRHHCAHGSYDLTPARAELVLRPQRLGQPQGPHCH